MTGPRWDSRRAELRQLAVRSRQMVLLAAVTGALTGVVVAGFEHLVVEILIHGVLLDLPLWLAAVAPAIGLAVAALCLRWIGGGATPGTADEYLRTFHMIDRPLGVRAAFGRLTAAVATLGSGGTMGLEGPSIYFGATIGSTIQSRLPRVLRSERRTLLVAGAAAGVAAIFKAPATGAVFALEAPYQDDLARRQLLPALVGAGSGYLAFATFKGTAPLLAVEGTFGFSGPDLVAAIALGIAAGIGARAFAKLIRGAKLLTKTLSAPVRVVASGSGLVVLFVTTRGLTGESLTIESGYDVVNWALDPGHALPIVVAVLVLRSAATALTVAGGGVGGLFIPLVVAGALMGRLVGGIVGDLDVTLFVVIGIAAFLGAGYRVPLAAVMFVAETTGRPSIVVPGLFAAVAAELMMGPVSITEFQRRPTPDPPEEPSARVEG